MSTEDDWRFDNQTLDSNATLRGNDTDADADATNVSLNFVDSFVKAFSVMIVSELGDKTFFLAGKNIICFSADVWVSYRDRGLDVSGCRFEVKEQHV
jgi:hypothetical protein